MRLDPMRRGCPNSSRFLYLNVLYGRKRDMTTNITPDHRATFEALTSRDYALF
jgi:hypothetical protein